MDILDTNPGIPYNSIVIERGVSYRLVKYPDETVGAIVYDSGNGVCGAILTDDPFSLGEAIADLESSRALDFCNEREKRGFSERELDLFDEGYHFIFHDDTNIILNRYSG